MEIVIIAAVSSDGYIGKEGSLPWNIPEDLKRFNNLTMGHPVIMGRKTYFSIPQNHRPLKGRTNYVLTSRDEIEGGTACKSLEEALDMIRRKEPKMESVDYSKVFIIGGESVYEAGMEIADTLEITHVDRVVLGDAAFPEIPKDFKIVKNEKRNGYDFTTYKRLENKLQIKEKEIEKSPKYIVVTGGVMSGLGKGILSASIGNILKACGYSINICKIDPYVNIDAGTMSPFEHGEVFVLDDGGELDLDFGHYERFVGIPLTTDHNLTTGKIFSSVIEKERRGDFLGKTVQIVPHITNEIKDVLRKHGNSHDFIIVEVGGTVGDIEGMAFMEALRQLRHEKEMINIHLTYLPLSGIDQKTKPTQHSVIQLRKLGIRPDIVVGRCDEVLRVETKRKLSLFCDVKEDAVISDPTLPSIYELPIHFANEGIHKQIQKKFDMDIREPDLKEWKGFLNSLKSDKEIVVGIVGKYSRGDTYLSIMEALTHAGAKLGTSVSIKWIDAEEVGHEIESVDAIITPGGFGRRGVTGKIKAIEYARKNHIPWLGLCLGFQLAVVELAQNELKLEANSTEFDAHTKHPVIIPHWEAGQKELGGTMRLGAIETVLDEDSQTARLYGKTTISERHRHRYGLNPKYRKQIESLGVKFTGVAPVDNTIEILEIPNQFFIGVQFHPELKSQPLHPHPLFLGLVRAALKNK